MKRLCCLMLLVTLVVADFSSCKADVKIEGTESRQEQTPSQIAKEYIKDLYVRNNYKKGRFLVSTGRKIMDLSW